MKQLTKKEIQILTAKPTKDVDRSKIKWRKQNLILKRGHRELRVKHNRPPAGVYWDILRKAGRNLNECEACSSDYKITVHHVDGNPFNNSLENLQVLCWNCHLLYHEPTEQGVHDDLEGTKADFDNLDNPEIRKFLGIVEEDIIDVDD